MAGQLRALTVRERFNELLGPGQPRLENFDEETFAHIGLLAHKYECDTIEEWARQKLDLRLLQLSQSKIKTKKRSKPTGPASPQSVRAVKPPEGQPQSPENLPIKVLEYLIGTSTKCNWVSVKKRAEQMLLDTIGSTPTPGKSDHIQTQLREVLESADALGDDGLKARAYYVFLRHMKWTLSQNECRNRLSGVESPNMRFGLSDIANSNLWCDSLYALTDAQKICLYRGFLGLMALRNQLRVVPEVGTKCACWAGLKEQWKIFAQKDGLPDDPKLFIGEAKNAISWGLVSTHAGECGRTELLREVDNFLKEFDACLVNFFPTQ